MDNGFLALLALYGSVLPPDSTGHYLDYNGDGVIDLYDLMEHLTLRPQAIENTTDFTDK